MRINIFSTGNVLASFCAHAAPGLMYHMISQQDGGLSATRRGFSSIWSEMAPHVRPDHLFQGRQLQLSFWRQIGCT